ncbi:MAG: DUF2326 domain-containing protein [Roseivirga sp.]|jgi:uncharacterized protein YydD (DUF2326 family)|uniref:DUF2326 domain-containing protein n=1 Tax=Roseivirga sp. TaxID=1964215 RepID=UPI001B1AAF19|nr:DUF2326 domain-containing protein [Roseivirga sp.]MBO6496321.1 DUF2326 domain-containing protein [Roseivirga sp.]
MFLKSLKIENGESLIREIPFHSGINLIVDETNTSDRKQSGNNVGKTTVLRLIDYCLAGKGENIYKDPEFKDKSNNQIIENFLKGNNIIITLILKEDLEITLSKEIVIRRNFLSRKEKIQEINGEEYGNDEFPKKLKELIFNSSSQKPTFRQIISKNIRDEKNRLRNTVKVLHPTTTMEEYEALYLFWLGINSDNSDRKQKILAQIKIEQNLQKRLRKESNYSRIEQALIIINRNIAELEEKRKSFNLNENYERDLEELNFSKKEINKLSTQISQLELRKELILESKSELEKEIVEVNISQVQSLYNEAKALIPNLQKSFEDTLIFHNQMIQQRLDFILKELPELDEDIKELKRLLDAFREKEKSYTIILQKTGALDELQKTIEGLNRLYEQRGNLEEQKRMWDATISTQKALTNELDSINAGIDSKDELINERITIFNKYFSEISSRLYNEQFILSADKNDRGYELNISSISGNLGTGKKKGQIAAFDLAYILFAQEIEIDHLHFIMHDQIENVHDNQITSLLTEIISGVNCQYILPVLNDKLPTDIDIDQYKTLSLSQSDKLFKI